jgi:hypothetical protein
MAGAFPRLEPDLPSNIDMDDVARAAGLGTSATKFVPNVDWTATRAGYETPSRVSPPPGPDAGARSGAWMAVRGLHTCGPGRPLLRFPKIR